MRLIRRIFGLTREQRYAQGRRATPPGPRPLAGVRGRMTAGRAVALGGPIGLELDPAARLVSIVSDTNIDAAGLAQGWEIFYDLPARGTQLTVSIGPCPDTDVSDDARVCLEMSERPFVAPLDAAFSASVARSLRMTVDEFEAKRRRQALDERDDPLPVPFRDSPEAVAALMEQGADFVSGPTDLAISTGRLKDGTVVWNTSDRHRDYTTPFPG
jgi:hypothetical protein